MFCSLFNALVTFGFKRKHNNINNNSSATAKSVAEFNTKDIALINAIDSEPIGTLHHRLVETYFGKENCMQDSTVQFVQYICRD